MNMHRPAVTLAVLVLALSLPLGASSGEWQTKFDEAKTDLTATGRNTYFVLEPGYVLVLDGTDDGRKAQLVVTVMDETKTVDGVETRVVEERESHDGKLVEVSRNFFAISVKTGNVYYFGEETFEGGRAKLANDSWESGVKGATYGMMLPGRSSVGMKYYQEQAPKIAMDRAEIVSISDSVEVPAGKFETCLKVEETTPLERGERSYKLYAPGVGLLADGELRLVKYGFEKK